MIYFMNTNGYEMNDISKEACHKKLEEFFPENDKLEDFEEFNASNFLTYNLSLIVAKHNILGISYDELKNRVEMFFIEFFKKS